MITTKDYIGPVVKRTFSTIFGFLFKIFLVFILATAFLWIIYLLHWFSIIPFAVIAFCYYVWSEANFNYRFDKDHLEHKIRNQLEWMGRLPGYWACDESVEDNNSSYKRATGDFIQMMEEYERKYGKNKFYEDAHSDWYNLDKYLRDALINKTF